MPCFNGIIYGAATVSSAVKYLLLPFVILKFPATNLRCTILRILANNHEKRNPPVKPGVLHMRA